MQVTVKLYARAKEMTGQDSVVLTLPSSACVRDLRNELAKASPALQPLLSQLFIAIDADYAKDETVIPENATIACFPPVSGG